MKIIAYYLPQFHQIPENNAWWGEGYTEWVTVKKAKPLFEGHSQPKVPLNNNYYNLLDIDTMRWQTQIAKKYGIYGFCFYHYWFNGKKLLEKPVENFLVAQDINFHYCLSWDNCHWTNQWVSDKRTVLIEQKYGKESTWKAHFEYLLPFFKDERYIKYKGKPLFLIYRPELIDMRKEMFAYMNQLALDAGLPGICFVCQRADVILDDPKIDLSMFDFNVPYQPDFAKKQLARRKNKFQNLRDIKKKGTIFLEKHFKIDSRSIVLLPHKEGPLFDNYDEIWDLILSEEFSQKNIPSAFINWDNTPRKGKRGSIIVGASPEKFQYYFGKLIKKRWRNSSLTDFLFIFAWNEWSEGGYLEPDEENGYGYLEAIRNVLVAEDEMPEVLRY